MKQQADPRFTSEIYARRFLNYGPDGTEVAWAEKMTLSGFVSDSLFILLGEVEPFNKFEIDELLDRIQNELHLPKVNHKDEALEIIATAYAQRFIQGKINSANALFALSQFCIQEDHADVIYDFYLLHYAAVDLATEDTQYYWPDAHRGNIEKVIRNRCIKWLEEHPLADWRNYEWAVA